MPKWRPSPEAAKRTTIELTDIGTSGRSSRIEPFPLPLALFVYNRPDQARAVVARLRDIRPQVLYVFADGPRADVPADAPSCLETLAAISLVDWDCRLHLHAASANMGCGPRLISGLDHVFGRERAAIVLEDDCLVSPSFFPYCRGLLERYRDETRVMHVGALGPLNGPAPGNGSYYFSRTTPVWGWATWERAWSRFDAGLSQWPGMRQAGALERVLGRGPGVRFLGDRLDDEYLRGPSSSTWDLKWFVAVLAADGLAALPRVNLVENRGFDHRGTNLVAAPSWAREPAVDLPFPLHHPATVQADAAVDRAAVERVFAGHSARRAEDLSDTGGPCP